MSYQREFRTAIRGHHIYKDTWMTYVGQDLICEKDTREEAQEYDKNVIDVFKLDPSNKSKTFVGHVPIELSHLLTYLLEMSCRSCQIYCHDREKRL